ncbi:hypothetical protein HBNCFIEN_01181 [Legionella sp. PC997]|nr:hypothetical protein HBNCFIEN_01181 [Legionella sp. PC997]
MTIFSKIPFIKYDTQPFIQWYLPLMWLSFNTPLLVLDHYDVSIYIIILQSIIL